jgi:peptidoglycan/LPS O-acetylase OafA/YrhL
MHETQKAPPQLDTRARFHPFVDSIRALCALYVVVCHAWFEPTSGYYPSRWMNLLSLSHGNLAVDVFIVVSGFVIVLPIARRGDQVGSVLTFFRRRARRILPPYYAALIFHMLVALLMGQQPTGTVWDCAIPITLSQVVAHALLVHDLPLHLTGGLIGYQLWSIAVEFQIYLLVPALMAMVRRWRFWPVVISCVVVSLVLDHWFPDLRSMHHWYVVLFLSGAGAARLVVRSPGTATRLAIPGLLLTGAVTLVIAAAGHHLADPWLPELDILVGAGSAMLIAGLVEPPPGLATWVKRMLSWSPLVSIGTFSYSLYLVHPALLHLFWFAFKQLGTAVTVRPARALHAGHRRPGLGVLYRLRTALHDAEEGRPPRRARRGVTPRRSQEFLPALTPFPEPNGNREPRRAIRPRALLLGPHHLRHRAPSDHQGNSTTMKLPVEMLSHIERDPARRRGIKTAGLGRREGPGRRRIRTIDAIEPLVIDAVRPLGGYPGERCASHEMKLDPLAIGRHAHIDPRLHAAMRRRVRRAPARAAPVRGIANSAHGEAVIVVHEAPIADHRLGVPAFARLADVAPADDQPGHLDDAVWLDEDGALRNRLPFGRLFDS